MSKEFEAMTDTLTNAEFITDPLPPTPTASRKRAWLWALMICGSAVAVSAYFHHLHNAPVAPVPAAAPAQQKFTLLAGDTVAIVPFATEDEGWRVLLVPTRGQIETIYYGDSEQATRIYALADAMQRKANDTGKAQVFTVPNDINQPSKN
ncbi:hypothetical protein [Sulfuriferula nivalis]|uniref:Uncharacterized protein n=1 Tax=Sulfuriferula nivalis TaxID=2675298 RepID=A0A809S8A8_9PROT|nr:hypothetical protein [Sulfuriferula nivalis]BBP00383.1 hypothetical protein SFSGTM_10910 [Sulfuriferula nivalis]